MDSQLQEMRVTEESLDSGLVYRVGNPPSGPRKKKSNKLFVILLAVFAVVVIGVGIALVWLVRSPIQDAMRKAVESPLVTAEGKCVPNSPYATIGDEGKTLILQSKGEEKPGIAYTELECIWTELKVSDAVRSEIVATRALDGRRSGDWGQFHASWSYHPDSGLQMTITLK